MGELTARFELPLGMNAPKAARDIVESVLRAWGYRDADWLDRAKVVVSELVTNAVVHGGGCLLLDLHAHDRGVTIAAADGEAAVPRRREPGAGGGYGLALIENVATRWGVGTHQDGGKRVWAELAPPPAQRTRNTPT